MLLVLMVNLLAYTKADPPECDACLNIVQNLNKFAKNPELIEKPAEIFTILCDVFEGPAYSEVCSGYANEFKYLVQDTVVDKFLDPEYTCKELGYCTSPQYIPEDFAAYTEKIMRGKPPGPGPQPTGRKSFEFVHISDVHLDKLYTPGSVSDCEIEQCCRTGNGTGINTAGYWGGFVCDLPLHTLYPALNQIKELKPEFILITGDFPPHDMWNQSISYVLEYQQMVSTAFRTVFPDTPLYVIFGNHFCFPINQCPYAKGEYWMPKPFAQYWGLSNQIRISLEEHAAYSVRHKNTNLVLLVLDTNVYNDESSYIMNNCTDPKGQLDWIYKQLLTAEENGDQVYIIGHIPPGDVNALPTWVKHFNVLVDRFEFTIAGLFYGHSHNDEIHIHRGVYSNLPTKVQWVAPSFSTFYYLNPSFRLFKADLDSKQLIDYTQYRLNLMKANLHPDVHPVWDPVYSFLNFYGLADMKAQTVFDFAMLVGNSEELSLKYLFNFFTGGFLTPSTCDSSCQNYNKCRMIYPDFESIFMCQGPTEDNLLYMYLTFLFADWAYKVY